MTGQRRQGLVAADGTWPLQTTGHVTVHGGALDLLPEAWEIPQLRRQLAEARAWAWAEYHREWFLQLTNPYAETGRAAPPAWLLSQQPPADRTEPP